MVKVLKLVAMVWPNMPSVAAEVVVLEVEREVEMAVEKVAVMEAGKLVGMVFARQQHEWIQHFVLAGMWFASVYQVVLA